MSTEGNGRHLTGVDFFILTMRVGMIVIITDFLLIIRVTMVRGGHFGEQCVRVLLCAENY